MSALPVLLIALLAAPCDAPGTDPWVGELRDRVLAFDDLAQYARRVYGDPVACDGAVSDEFDGLKFGRVTLSFGAGISMEVQTMPPETSLVTLRSDDGFTDGEGVEALLRDYAARRGLSIDWSTPEITTEGDQEVRTFWDPEPGLNASAALIFRDTRLVGVRLSLAL